ncbi:MAG: formylglycine-generating enzyme family protein [Candidatus Eremiobacterota bacterium]
MKLIQKFYILIFILSLSVSLLSSDDVRPYIEPDMVFIKGGTFQMGQTDIAMPVHQVTLSDFYIGTYEVTNKEYSLFDPEHENPGDNLPVVNVTWDEACAYCQWLSGKTGKTYRLPTEAEWEYACRAGTTTEYYWGTEMDDEFCWYFGNSEGKVHPVGQRKPNLFGLYDMMGNVWEWCSDWFGDYPAEEEINPAGADFGTFRVYRGGCWCYDAYCCRSAIRNSGAPMFSYDYLGFRIVKQP